MPLDLALSLISHVCVGFREETIDCCDGSDVIASLSSSFLSLLTICVAEADVS